LDQEDGELMGAFGDLIDWFSDGEHWTGPDGVPIRVLEHIEISAAGVAFALAVAVPVGFLIGHFRRGQFAAVSIANLGRAIPSFAILSIVFQVMATYFGAAAFGFWPTVIALFLLAIPPILTNTYVGIEGVDRDTVEAARGMGMTEGQVLAKLELPLAIPLMIAGIRTAAVQVVATATLAALIAGGGLGRYIIDGFAQNDTPKVLAGAVLVAVLAIVTELGFGLLERVVSPRTSSQGRRRRREPVLSEAFPSSDAGLVAGG
jgi:osmoprotectant transport system permease protein